MSMATRFSLHRAPFYENPILRWRLFFLNPLCLLGLGPTSSVAYLQVPMCSYSVRVLSTNPNCHGLLRWLGCDVCIYVVVYGMIRWYGRLRSDDREREREMSKEKKRKPKKKKKRRKRGRDPVGCRQRSSSSCSTGCRLPCESSNRLVSLM